MHYKDLHERAVQIVARCKRAEAELIEILQKIDQTKSYREYECTSLFYYAVDRLGLSEDVAYNFINVARKALEVPALQAAISKSEITVSKAKKITSVLTLENQDQWLEMAKTLPQKKLEKEVARVHPKAAVPDHARYVTEKRMQLTMGLSEDLMEQFKRAQDLECQRTQKPVDYEQTLKALLELYLDQHGPVRKNPKKLVARLVRKPEPKKLSAGRKRFILSRHQSQCAHIDRSGQRCPERRWLQIHHLKERSHGGSHAITNLTLLCATHHRLQHCANGTGPSGVTLQLGPRCGSSQRPESTPIIS